MSKLKLKQYVVDAFTDKVFSGNPAAICISDTWLSDSLMQEIAKENNLSETAFVVKEGDYYGLRWFTPKCEVDLCGHATLASAYVINNFIDKDNKIINFKTKSGILKVYKNNDLFEMDLPIYELKPIEVTEKIISAVGKDVKEAYIGRDLLCILESEDDVKKACPDAKELLELDGLLLHISAKGSRYDCISRSFGPKCDVYEDPVCGSGHCHIMPYWFNKLNKNSLKAYQASARGGLLFGRQNNDHIIIGGKAVLYSEATIYFDNNI